MTTEMHHADDASHAKLSNIEKVAESNDEEPPSSVLEEFLLLQEEYMALSAGMAELRKEATRAVDDLYAVSPSATGSSHPTTNIGLSQLSALAIPVPSRVLLNLALRKVVDSLKMGSWDNPLKSHAVEHLSPRLYL
ncbi:hypothetical protein F5141DRAFT_1294271 [Pisolithus sp. B1]|nr:hypothetical protein F5141DRAFT_1294271 [Pisolithus sp. B1]